MPMKRRKKTGQPVMTPEERECWEAWADDINDSMWLPVEEPTRTPSRNPRQGRVNNGDSRGYVDHNAWENRHD